MYTPYIPPIYSKTGVNRGKHYFLIFALKHRLWVLVRTAFTEAVLTCTHNLCFEHKYENYYNFSSENFNDNGPIRAHLISGPTVS